MAQLRLAMGFVALVVLSSCGSQLQRPAVSQAVIEEKREQERQVTPTFRYRPG